MQNPERNYSRFYSMINRLPGFNKETFIMQYTNGRTARISETTPQEYNTICHALEEVSGYAAERRDRMLVLRRQRSRVLKLMQQLGIDTTNWDRVNAFCLDPRIAGAPFALLNFEQQKTLETKLRAIARHGGLKPKEEAGTNATGFSFIDTTNIAEA